MKYATGRAFRQALEDKLRTEHAREQIPRLRKMIAFERFMARLDDRWILKGGYALQLRTEKARPTQDIDLATQPLPPAEMTQALQTALRQDLADFFNFSLEQPQADLLPGNTTRFRITARLAGRIFEQFHIDIGTDNLLLEPAEYIQPPELLGFADIAPKAIPCYPVSQHIAEKIHALLQPRPIASSRVKNLIDMLLFATLDNSITSTSLIDATQAVFSAHNHHLPPIIPALPPDWPTRFDRQARNLDLPYTNYAAAFNAMQVFLHPVLAGKTDLSWHPDTWQWD